MLLFVSSRLDKFDISGKVVTADVMSMQKGMFKEWFSQYFQYGTDFVKKRVDKKNKGVAELLSYISNSFT